MVLWLTIFLANEAKPSRTFVTEVMIIPHINVKKLWKSRSDNSRTEKGMKKHFLVTASRDVL